MRDESENVESSSFILGPHRFPAPLESTLPLVRQKILAQ